MTDQGYESLRVCLDCGKCTGACPVAQASGGLSPRRIIRESLDGAPERAVAAAKACLTCRRCDSRCPSAIPYTDTVQQLRERNFKPEHREAESHCGIFGVLSRLQRAPGLKPERLGWLTGDLETDDASDTLLWIGCSPHFAAYFDKWCDEILGAPRAAVRLMNRLGVKPAVSAQERCCGHDALWMGDRQTFDELAKTNLAWLARSKAKTIVFLCPSCAQAFRKEIPERGGEVKQETTTLVEWLAARADQLDPGLREQVVAWHDPCRLGRHAGVYDAPREVLDALPGVERREMDRSGKGAVCCGGGNWAHCDGATRHYQEGRLDEAAAVGAEALVTACPRCLIHLRCAKETLEEDRRERAPRLVDLGRFVDEACNGNT